MLPGVDLAQPARHDRAAQPRVGRARRRHAHPPISDPITIHGTTDFSAINEGGDFPADHITDDQNTYLFTDPADTSLVATGNVGPLSPAGGNIELEWEIGSYPLFAWAGSGDRLTGVGRWIWDCGHPDADPTGTSSKTTSQACIIDSDCRPPVCPGCVGGETCTGVTSTITARCIRCRPWQ